MKITRIVSFVAVMLMLMGLAVPVPGLAERGWGREDRYRERERQYARDPNWVLDRRHSHNHYYPRRGFVTRELPRDYRIIRHRRDRYYLHDGIWYRSSPGGFVVVTPPVGLVVPLLPPFYTTIWVGGNPYYYADGVYYRWLPAERAYVVSESPPEQAVVEEAALPKDLFVYPKEGQSREQQDSDRYECHRWAVTESGFDPTQPGGNVPEAQNTVKRSEYQRAMKACLEARGYSVQ